MGDVLEIGKIIHLNERNRKYFFPMFNEFEDTVFVFPLEFSDAKRLIIRPDGTHWIQTGDGYFHIVQKGFINIEIDADEDPEE